MTAADLQPAEFKASDLQAAIREGLPHHASSRSAAQP